MLGKILMIEAFTKTNVSYYLRLIIFSLFKIINIAKSLFKVKMIKEQCKSIIENSNYEAVDIFCFRFGWNASSFQRAQHIASNLAKSKVLIFYAKNPFRDKQKEFFTKIENNLYLIDIDNPILMYYLRKNLKSINKKKLIHTCSTNLYSSYNYLMSFKNEGYTILYEYIDEISAEISGTKIPNSFLKMHSKLIKDKDNIIVSSAQILYDKVYKIRKAVNNVLACNGVEYEHWQVDSDSYKKYEDITKIAEEGKPIIGYFGALANWFDYDLLGYLAVNRPNYNFVLIGWGYDNAFSNSKITKLKNVRFLGPKNYSQLNSYITAFAVCIIPFKVNEITLSTSPVKLFEYLAAGKPSVCTAMPECMAVNEVFIGNTYEEFINKLDEAVLLKDDIEFINKLKKVALENSWSKKVQIIIKNIKGR